MLRRKPDLNKEAQKLAWSVEFLTDFSFNEACAGKVADGEREVGGEEGEDESQLYFSGQRGT